MPSNDNLSEVAEQFIALVAQRYSQPTLAAYSQALHVFSQHMRLVHKIIMRNASASQLELGWGQSFMNWLQGTRSVETEHLYMRVIYQFYEYVAQIHKLDFEIAELAQYVEQHRRPKTHVIPTLPFDAIEKIIQFAAATPTINSASDRELLGQLRDRAFILTLRSTGLRISEICDLRKHQLGSDSISLGENASLPIPAPVSGALQSYLSRRVILDQQQPIHVRDNLPLFARHDKRVASRILPISRWTGANIVSAWLSAALTPEERKTLEQSNQVITPHTFRHYFVLTALMNTDHDLVTTQTLARHEDRSTTRRYLAKIANNSPSNA